MLGGFINYITMGSKNDSKDGKEDVIHCDSNDELLAQKLDSDEIE